jgi:hypothetical protein
MWYTARHFRHPVHPQQRVTPHPSTEMNVPIPVWIFIGVVVGMIGLALASYSMGLWDTMP